MISARKSPTGSKSSGFISRLTAETSKSSASTAKPCSSGGCPHAAMTIKGGLERILREEIDPEIVIERVL